VLLSLCLVIAGLAVWGSHRVVAAGFLLLDVTLLACPFVTGTTAGILGIRRGLALGRLAGCLFAAWALYILMTGRLI
jgi:hypothetical protein